MAGILQFLEDAIQPAVAARAGYLQGQTAKSQAQAALARQSALDQIDEAVKSAQVQADLARANRDDNYMPPDPLVQVENPDGTSSWMPRSQAIGKRAPGPRPLAPTTGDKLHSRVQQLMQQGLSLDQASRQARLEYGQSPGADNGGDGTDGGITPAQSRRIATTKAYLDEVTKFSPRPSKVPKPPMTMEMGPDGKLKSMSEGDITQTPAYKQAVTDSLAYDKSTVQPARKAYDEAVSGVLPAATAAPGGSGGSGAGTPTPEDITGEYQQAAEAYKAAIASGQNPDQARALYGQIVTAIAKKHGFIQ